MSELLTLTERATASRSRKNTKAAAMAISTAFYEASDALKMLTRAAEYEGLKNATELAISELLYVHTALADLAEGEGAA